MSRWAVGRSCDVGDTIASAPLESNDALGALIFIKIPLGAVLRALRLFALAIVQEVVADAVVAGLSKRAKIETLCWQGCTIVQRY